MGPISDRLGFRRRRSDISLALSLMAVPTIGRSEPLFEVPIAIAKACSGSGLFRPDVIESSLSFAGKSWYLRVSEGCCNLQTNFSFPFSSAADGGSVIYLVVSTGEGSGMRTHTNSLEGWGDNSLAI